VEAAVSSVQPWRTGNVDSADLAAGLRAARALQRVPVPPWLSKQLANYALRVTTELASRDIDPEQLLADGSKS
jgi:hypothetical protein